MEDNKFLNLARVLMEGQDSSSFEEQKEAEQLVNVSLHLIRSGFFGRGKPALICRDFVPQRIAKVICTEYDAGKVVYEEDEMIRYVDPDNASTFPVRGLEGMRLGGAAIEMNTRVFDFDISNDVQQLLLEVWNSEHKYTFLPRSLVEASSWEQMEAFYVKTLPRLSPVYFCFGENGLGGYTGIYLINISHGSSIGSNRGTIEFAVLEYHIKPNSSHLNPRERVEIRLRSEVYGMDVDISIPLSPPGNEVRGEILRSLSNGEYISLVEGLADFSKKEILNVDRSYLFMEK